MRRLHDTQGLCPRCLRRLPAYYEEDDDGAVYLTRSCPEHGTFAAQIWPSRKEAPDIPGFESWRVDKTPSYPDAPETDVADGCPYDCGLCPVHAQHTCHGLIELTMRCNLSCPLCYASSGQGELPADPSREVVRGELRRLLEKSGRCNVQLSGGEFDKPVAGMLGMHRTETAVIGAPVRYVRLRGIRIRRRFVHAPAFKAGDIRRFFPGGPDLGSECAVLGTAPGQIDSPVIILFVIRRKTAEASGAEPLCVVKTPHSFPPQQARERNTDRVRCPHHEQKSYSATVAVISRP